MRAETVVVGGGPSGAAAAIVLARAGRDVLLVDKATFPRDKCCGDGLTALALREYEFLGLDPSHIESWNVVRDVAVRSPSGTERYYSLPDGPGYHAAVVPRIDLDAALLELARAAGARVEPGCAVTGTEVSDDTIDVLIDNNLDNESERCIRTSNLIAADGMWSPVRKSLGLGVDQYLGEWHAFRQYYCNVTGRAAEELIVWFEPDLLPGYAWSFPLRGGRANIGFGIRRGGRHTVGDMKRLWLDLLARPHIQQALGADAVAEAPHKAWPIPARIGRVPLVGPHTMFVGDAAAVTDPMTGEGIGQALLTGRLAAESVLAHNNPTAHYEKAVRKELVADDRMSRALIPLLARPWVTRGVLRLTGTTAWTRRNFARWMFEGLSARLAGYAWALGAKKVHRSRCLPTASTLDTMSEFSDTIDEFDEVIDQWWEQWRNQPLVDRVFYTASEAADFSLLWHALGVVQAIVEDDPKIAMGLSAALGVESALLNGPIKSIFRRRRPLRPAPRAAQPASTNNQQFPEWARIGCDGGRGGVITPDRRPFMVHAGRGGCRKPSSCAHSSRIRRARGSGNRSRLRQDCAPQDCAPPSPLATQFP